MWQSPRSYGESRAEELGQQRRKVTGEGYFSGPDCMERWAALQRAYAQEGPGRLQLPGLTPFWALMDRLELTGAQGKDLVRYSFPLRNGRGSLPFREAEPTGRRKGKACGITPTDGTFP